MTDAPRYTLVLRPMPDRSDPDGIRRLRAVLKCLLRSYGMRCERCKPAVTEGGQCK